MKDWKKICVLEHETLLNAMRIINESGARFSLVLSADGKLKGTLTDGDIRRAILNGVKLEDSVDKVMNNNPIIADINASKVELSTIMKTHEITHIPLVDENKKLIAVLSLKDVQVTQPIKENAVVLMAGGLGSRLGELTANCPKPMLKLGDKPILEILIENLREDGFYNFYLSVNYMSEMIESYFEDGQKLGVSIKYIREKERMGTAGSLSMLEPINELPVIVMNADVITKINFSTLIEFQEANQFDACLCVSRHDYQIPFGVVECDGDLVKKIEEKPIQSSLVNAGIYSLNPDLLKLIPKNTFFDMPSLLDKIIAEKKRLGVFQIQDYWLDIGRRDDFYRARNDYNNKIK